MREGPGRVQGVGWRVGCVSYASEGWVWQARVGFSVSGAEQVKCQARAEADVPVTRDLTLSAGTREASVNQVRDATPTLLSKAASIQKTNLFSAKNSCIKGLWNKSVLAERGLGFSLRPPLVQRCQPLPAHPPDPRLPGSP